jgi:hypothetical protein
VFGDTLSVGGGHMQEIVKKYTSISSSLDSKYSHPSGRTLKAHAQGFKDAVSGLAKDRGRVQPQRICAESCLGSH